MAQVTLRINGFNYTLGCPDGEESHLHARAEEVVKRIDTAKASVGQSGESRMLVMAALMLADDLFESRKRVAELEAEPAGAPAKPDRKLATRINRMAKRAEDIAADLEHP